MVTEFMLAQKKRKKRKENRVSCAERLEEQLTS